MYIKQDQRGHQGMGRKLASEFHFIYPNNKLGKNRYSCKNSISFLWQPRARTQPTSQGPGVFSLPLGGLRVPTLVERRAPQGQEPRSISEACWGKALV